MSSRGLIAGVLRGVRTSIAELTRRETDELARDMTGKAQSVTAGIRHELSVDDRNATSLGNVNAGVGVAHVSESDIGRSVILPLHELLEVDPRMTDDEVATRALKPLEKRYGPYSLHDLSGRYEFKQRAPGSAFAEIAYISMRGNIVDDTGKKIGLLEHQFQMDVDDRVVVRIAYMRIDEKDGRGDSARGRGFGTVSTSEFEDRYRTAGVDRIEVHAGSDDGGHFWARRGYRWDTSGAEYFDLSIANVKNRIDRVREESEVAGNMSDVAVLGALRGRMEVPIDEYGTIGKYPSPLEIDMTEGEDSDLGVRVMRGSQWGGVKKLQTSL